MADLSIQLTPKLQQGSTYIIQWTNTEEQTVFIIEAVGLGKQTNNPGFWSWFDLVWFGFAIALRTDVGLPQNLLSLGAFPSSFTRTHLVTVHIVSSWSEPRQHSKQGISLSLGTEYASLSSTGQNPGCQNKYPDDKGPNSQWHTRNNKREKSNLIADSGQKEAQNKNLWKVIKCPSIY